MEPDRGRHHAPFPRTLTRTVPSVIDWRRRSSAARIGKGGRLPGDDDDPFGEPVPIPIDGTLDLHAFKPGEVRDLLPDWIEASREAGFTEVRVVHGKGTGAMRRTVEAILGRTPGVVTWRLATAERGSWGATIVTLAPAAPGEGR